MDDFNFIHHEILKILSLNMIAVASNGHKANFQEVELSSPLSQELDLKS